MPLDADRKGESKMSFGENLQYLRKRENITQEQLAERLEVSRQTISKWESGASYPEMEKLLFLCEMFDSNMDTLLRGNVEEGMREDKAVYDKHMNTFSRQIAASVACIVAGAGLAAIMDGMNMGDSVLAFVFFSILLVSVVTLVIAGIRHSEFCAKYPAVQVEYSEEEKEKVIRRFPVQIGAGIGLILFGLLLVALSEGFQISEDLMGGVFLLFVAAGTASLIYGGMQRDKIDVQKYNRENNPTGAQKRRNDRIGRICGCIMIAATMVFLLLGFLKDLWHIAWVSFVVGGMLCGIVSTALGREEE